MGREMEKAIRITGAAEHNLKDINLSIPRDKLVVITGISGSGKSSLAFDTIYAEGQRRYVESLSAYARQFLGVMEKPEVDYIEGLSPAIIPARRWLRPLRFMITSGCFLPEWVSRTAGYAGKKLQASTPHR